jgi:O-acetyl-ADP-ribose deacetylase (regulator of RNase III)
MAYKEITGDLVSLALAGSFDVVAHGCNCFCTQKSGLAPQMAKAFGTNQFVMEGASTYGQINKLGQIDYEQVNKHLVPNLQHRLVAVNCYTQYSYGRDKAHLDYDALGLCLKKLNHLFKGKRLGLPQIGCGLAGGDWLVVKRMIEELCPDLDVTVVMYDK